MSHLRRSKSLLPHSSLAASLVAMALLGALPAKAQRDDDLASMGSLPPDHEPPVGVLGAALAASGRLTFTWTWEGVEKGGVREGSHEGFRQDVLDAGFSAVATGAKEEIHRFGVHFEPIEGLDLDLVVPYRDARIDIAEASGSARRLRTNGLGDLELSGLWSRSLASQNELSYGIGLGMPTGETDRVHRDESGSEEHLPYFLQPGSAAWSLMPRAYFIGRKDDWSWGYGGQYTARLRKGGESWNKGNELELGAWAAHRIDRDTSISLRIEGRNARGPAGTDPDIDALASNLHDPDNMGGTLIRLFGGVNYVGKRGHRFGAEIGVPLHDDVNGTQVSTNMTYGVGWRYSF